MVMTTADLDQDGREEIVIGSTTRAFRGNAFQATASEGPQLMVIEEKRTEMARPRSRFLHRKLHIFFSLPGIRNFMDISASEKANLALP